MSTEKELQELMSLVDSHGNACENFGDYQTIKNADSCIALRGKIEASLRALLAELEEAREDAARYQWLRNEARKSSPKISIGIWGVNGNSHCGKIGSTAEEVDLAIDAARKGEA